MNKSKNGLAIFALISYNKYKNLSQEMRYIMDFIEYWELLHTIRKDSNVEQYYDELLRPLFKQAIRDITNVKVIPTFDTRYHGRQKRGKYECITGINDKLVWPDYIFVPDNYTHDAPISPYIKVEFKIPNIRTEGEKTFYYPIYKPSIKFIKEIESELSETPLILTDGITWLFMKSQTDLKKLRNEEGMDKICFVEKVQKYYSGNIVKLFYDSDKRFDVLKKKIASFIEESELYKVTNPSSSLIQKI